MKKISKSRALAYLVFGFLGYVALLFLPAGTLDWPEAWLFLTICFVYAGMAVPWLIKHDPALLKKRMAVKMPTRGWDKAVVSVASVFMLAVLPLAALDAVRYQWSYVPLILKALGFVGIALSFALVFLVMKENTYLSRVVEIQKKRHHKVITTGPYRYVRHPMYVGVIVMIICTPVALGSLYAIIPAFFAALAIVARTYFEDKTLHKELKGYMAYAKKTRYRLVPGVW